MLSYAEFIASKMQAQVPRADREAKAPWWDLFEWQHLLVERALSRGRSAMFADTGAGKTRMELAWATAVCEVTIKPTLLLAPLAVSKQIVREAGEVGAEATYSPSGPSDWITVSNYERLHHFNPADFGAIVLDESSILKSFDGKTRRELTEFASTLPYRLCATATPAPNDYLELGQHSEFLSVLSAKEMMALYFTQDGNSTQKWRMKRHAEQDFWRWVSSWAMAMRRPSDVGFPDGDALYELPPLTIHQTEVVAENNHALGTLFRDEARTLSERRTARKETLMERVEAAVALVAKEPNEQWLLWCGLNAESEQLAKLIPGAIEVTGADSPEHKEGALLGFADGSVRILVSKASIAGFGMNYQSCARVIFVGLDDSFERYYQAVRRCWRFGQTRPVEVYIVTADVEGAVVRNIESKQRRAEQMAEELLQAMSDRTLEHLAKGVYESDDAQGEHWRLMLGDCVERLSEVEDDSVGLTVFSPPFPSMYVYTDQTRDMGNVNSVEQMIEHFGFLVPELLRVTMPGRSVAIHLAQAQTRKRDGEEIGLRDFRGATIAAMEAHGFTYYGEVCIDKALREGTPVLTPTGWTPIETLRIGDDVIGGDGTPTVVRDVLPQGERDIWRVTFSDRATVDCDGGHLWTVRPEGRAWNCPPDRQWVTLTTAEIAASVRTPKGTPRYEVPIVSPVEWPEANLPLDPYLVGVLLGDGIISQRNVGICVEAEIAEAVAVPVGCTVAERPYSRKGEMRLYGLTGSKPGCNEVMDRLRDLGLMGCRAWEKFVPTAYKRASIDQRLAIVRGMMDTDGTCKQNGQPYFATVSRVMADDLREIVESLGGLARIAVEKTTHRDCYVLTLRMPQGINPFRYRRKADRWHKSRGIRRTIVAVERLSERADCRCITVAAADGLFVAEHHVVTHNCPQIKAIRTKDRGLLFKTLAKDSANMRMAQADYLLQFRKPGENPQPIAAGISERYGNEDGWITPEEWIEWAAPVWYRAGPDYPGGIRETDVLNVSAARDERDERHLCPLQLGVIERAVKLWSAPGDLILSPFAGVGSEGVVAIGLNRRYVGIELKRSYWQTAVRNLENAHSTAAQGTLALT